MIIDRRFGDHGKQLIEGCRQVMGLERMSHPTYEEPKCEVEISYCPLESQRLVKFSVRSENARVTRSISLDESLEAIAKMAQQTVIDWREQLRAHNAKSQLRRDVGL